MFLDTPSVHAQLDRLDAMIERHPGLLDTEFDQDLSDLVREFEDLRQSLID